MTTKNRITDLKQAEQAMATLMGTTLEGTAKMVSIRSVVDPGKPKARGSLYEIVAESESAMVLFRDGQVTVVTKAEDATAPRGYRLERRHGDDAQSVEICRGPFYTPRPEQLSAARTVAQIAKRMLQAEAATKMYTEMIRNGTVKAMDAGVNNMMLIGANVGLAWALNAQDAKSMDHALAEVAGRIALVHGPGCGCEVCQIHRELAPGGGARS